MALSDRRVRLSFYIKCVTLRVSKTAHNLVVRKLSKAVLIPVPGRLSLAKLFM